MGKKPTLPCPKCKVSKYKILVRGFSNLPVMVSCECGHVYTPRDSAEAVKQSDRKWKPTFSNSNGWWILTIWGGTLISCIIVFTTRQTNVLIKIGLIPIDFKISENENEPPTITDARFYVTVDGVCIVSQTVTDCHLAALGCGNHNFEMSFDGKVIIGEPGDGSLVSKF